MTTRPIDRRQFLLGALGVATTAALPRRNRSKAQPINQLVDAPLLGTGSTGAGTLVLCTLYGGNDGLNTVVPLNDPAYISLRGNIAIAPEHLLPLGDGFGLNPVLVGFKTLWDAGHLAIVHGIGYPNPNLSHFQSMDIWHSGSTRNDVGSGWIGRWLDRTRPDPYQAFSIGPTVLPALAGNRRKATALQDSSWGGAQRPNGDPRFLNGYRALQRRTPQLTTLESGIAHAGNDLLDVSNLVSKALDREPAPTYPSGVDAGNIGTQLGIVSQLIRAGMPSRVYSVTQGGFDTHAGEVGTQSANLKQLDAAVTAFNTAIASSPSAGSTVLLIYSEFGRRVQSNASGGSDHGAASVCFIVGRSVRGGFYGEPPSLTKLDENGNLIHNIDFRSVYATLFEQTLRFEPRAVLGATFPSLGFL